MQKKTNDQVLLIAVIIIAVSIILQTFAMKSIIGAQTYSEEYTYDNFIDTELLKYKRTPIPREILDAEFSVYKHVSEDGKCMVIFTQEQFDELSQMRSDKTRDPLSIDEVLYIIEDSIDIYFSYESVTLTGYFDIFSSHFRYVSVSRPTDIEKFRPFDYYYERVISDIYRIIYFRLSVHDSGLLDVYEMKKHNESIFAVRTDDLKDLYNDGWILETVKYVMLINETTSIDENYEINLVTDFYTYLQNHKNTQHKEALDFDSISIQNPAVTITEGEHEIVMWDTKNLAALKLFPTTSLETRAKEIYDNWLSEHNVID